MTTESFTRRFVPALGRDVFRLGLACNYGLDAQGFERALERGVEYVFFTHMRTGHIKEPLKRALKERREKVVLATGPSVAFFGGNVRRGAERILRDLAIDYIDVFQLFWLGTGSAWTDGTIDALAKLKEEGKVKRVGISIHDRERAGRLAEDSPLDLFMIRYNAAHPGAEQDIFPHLAARRPAVVAYTATSWRKLMKAPAGWSRPAMTAGDCYRFCLTSPHVDVVLTGPKTWVELDESMNALARGPLSAEEEKWMRELGRVVHGGRPALADAIQ
jgi:aryl-alcohol dehydrogenase-like predicted oxidoreductase